MNKNLNAVNESTVAGLGRLTRFFGFNDVMGRLYGTLLMNPEPMSLDDLAETLQISKGSVSMNMRSIERWGMAREVWMRGERKKYYTAESDLWTVIRTVLSGREMREVSTALNVLGKSVEKLRLAEEELTDEEKKLAAYYMERVGDLQSFFEFAQMLLSSFVASEDGPDFGGVTNLKLDDLDSEWENGTG
ncbi:MAG: DNA-binding transcriptional regulator GbsR (MarR family) [Cellvibrionaceae bacterium]|jgi:DNA-binding transcriptional regulator GbsR (MarR family)